MASLYKRKGGKIWWGRIERQGREHRRSFKTTNRTVAEGRLRAWIEELEGTQFGEKPRRSYAEAEARFIRDHLPTLKLRGAERYGVSLKNLSEHFGARMLHEISSGLLSEFESTRRTAPVEVAAGRHAKRILNGVSASTIRRDLSCLSSILTCAMEWEWIDVNPVPAYLRRRAKRGLREGNPHTRYLTEMEEARLLEAATAAVRDAITVAIDSGLRREEQFSLQWRQVDFVRGTITTTTRTKSGRSRKVPLPLRSAAILGRLKGKNATATDDVFINPDTGERYLQMNKGLAGAVRRAKIDRLCWHDLRRTAGCRWLQRDGKSMEEVMVLLGHSSVQVTEKHYAFLEGEAVAESLGGGNVVKLERKA
jgi:integrase